MKIGDKVYCIKNILCYEKGNYYYIQNNFNYYNNPIYSICSIKVNNITYDFRKGKIFGSNFSGILYHEFDEYFKTMKELRKDKLDKLNEGRR